LPLTTPDAQQSLANILLANRQSMLPDDESKVIALPRLKEECDLLAASIVQWIAANGQGSVVANTVGTGVGTGTGTGAAPPGVAVATAGTPAAQTGATVAPIATTVATQVSTQVQTAVETAGSKII
jgi:hypothetical protein